MLFNYMGSWYMNLSDTWVVSVCGNLIPWEVGSKNKCLLPPPGIFFGIVLSCFCFKFKTLKAAINNESTKAGLCLCFSVPLVQASQASLCCVLEQDTLILA